MTKRKSKILRKTKETTISVDLALDGKGRADIKTGIGFLDHMLTLFSKHGLFDMKIRAKGDLCVDKHHTNEDVGICLGEAFKKALGKKAGIRRYGYFFVPMDEALANVAIDLSGRGYCVLEAEFQKNDMRGFQSDLIRHFLESFAMEGRLNLHARVLYGINDHHKAEALFKALGRALDMATRIDERTSGELPSTKQRIEK